MLLSRPTLIFKPIIPHLFIIYLLSLPPHDRSLFLAFLLRLLPPLPSHSLRVLQWNAGGLRARSTELLHFLCPIVLTLSAFRNPIFTPFSLSRFLNFLLCDLIAPTPSLAFSLLIPRTLAAASSFSSGRAYLSLNFLSLLFLRLIPTLIM